LRCFVFSFLAAAFTRDSLPASAQQPASSPPAMSLLSRLGCETGASVEGDINFETGYIAMLGVSAKAYAFRVINNGAHALMIPLDLCRDTPPSEQRTYSFILGHSFRNNHQLREGYYYLMNQSGQLVNAVHFQEGRAHMFAYADISLPVRRADFEAEKAIWMSKVSAAAD
jgi:hypothetical protein